MACGDILIQTKGTEISSFKTLGGDEFGDFLKIFEHFYFLKSKLEKFIRTKSCKFVFYISISNFRRMQSTIKKFEIFAEGPFNMENDFIISNHIL